MIVVSNTTPLRYLIEVGAIDILPRLFAPMGGLDATIATTPTVLAELRQDHFPATVRQWAMQPPTWLSIGLPRQVLPVSNTIHAGEAEAIALAIEWKADRLLIDDAAGVVLARSLNLRVLRTLTLLAVAGELGFIALAPTLQRLADETQFRVSRAILRRFIELDPTLRQIIARETSDMLATRK